MFCSQRWWQARISLAASLLQVATALAQPSATPAPSKGESVPPASSTPWRPRVELSYEAPKACPDGAAASTQLTTTTNAAANTTASETPADYRLTVKVVASRDGFRGWAELRAQGQTRGPPAFVRELAGPDCADIVSALMLSVSLHLEGSQPTSDAAQASPEASPSSAAPTSTKPAPDRADGDVELDVDDDDSDLPHLEDPYRAEGAMRWAPFLVLGMTVRGGWAPSLDGAWNGSLGLKGLGEGFRGARVSAGPTGQILDGAHAEFRHSWIGAATEICPYAARWEEGTVSVLPCFLGTIGHYRIERDGILTGSTVGALDVRLELDVQIRWFTIALQAGASFPVDPIDVVGENGEVFTQSVGVVGGVYVHYAPFEFFL